MLLDIHINIMLLYDLTCAPSFNSSVCPTGTWLSSMVHIELSLSMAWNTLFSPGNLDRWISLIWLTSSLWVQSFVANIPSCSITWFFVLFNFWTSASGQLKNKSKLYVVKHQRPRVKKKTTALNNMTINITILSERVNYLPTLTFCRMEINRGSFCL